MKKLLALTLVSSSLLVGSNSVRAEWDYWGYKVGSKDATELYTINSSTGQSTLKSNFCLDWTNPDLNIPWCHGVNSKSINEKTGQPLIEIGNIDYTYDINSNSWSSEVNSDNNDWSSGFSSNNLFKRINTYQDSDGNKILKLGGSKIIEKKLNGEVHIGENSWITKEENGKQKVWAKDAYGNSIPIDYTNGSKLLINGRDVEQSINNVGALSAALTGLPTVPTDTTLTCGLGTGTHGGDFAFSGGCASKVNEKLSINYAASMTMPGQDYAGDFEDKFSARAGFIWKLGKSNQPTQISMKTKEEMEEKIYSLEENNKKIISQNTDLKQKNQSIISQNKELLARLERLEKVTLGESQSKDLASIKLP